jgi:hypothetical protein
MVEEQRNVFVGKVLAETGVVYVRDLPYTTFEVAVEQVVAGEELEAGEHITFLIAGGPLPGGQAIIDETTHQFTNLMPLWGPVQPGRRYLMFASDGTAIGYPGFAGDGFARFELTDTDLIAPNGWFPAATELLGVTKEEVTHAWNSPDRDTAFRSLARVSVAEAAVSIRAAIAEAPLPDPSWLLPWIEYWKTNPTPSPAAIPAPSPAASPAQPPIGDDADTGTGAPTAAP